METFPNPTVLDDGTLDADSMRKYKQLLGKKRDGAQPSAAEKEFLSKCINLMNQGKLAANMVSFDEAERIFKEARNDDGLVDPSKLPPKKLDPTLHLNPNSSAVKGDLKELAVNSSADGASGVVRLTEAEGEDEIMNVVGGSQENKQMEDETDTQQALEEARKMLGGYLDTKVGEVPGLRERIDGIKATGGKVQARLIGDDLFVYEVMRHKKYRDFQIKLQQSEEDLDVELELLKTFCVHPDFTQITLAERDNMAAGSVPTMVELISLSSGFNNETSIPFEL